VRVWIGFAALWLVVPFVPALRAQEKTGSVEQVARMPVFWPPGVSPQGLAGNGSMIFNAKARRAYQVFLTPDSKTVVQAVDLDSLKQVGSATYDFQPVKATPGGTSFGERMHAVDEDHNKIYLAYELSGTWQGIAEIDGGSLRLERRLTRAAAFQPQVDPQNPCTSTNCIPTPVGVAPNVRGMAFVPAITSPASRDKLLLLLQDNTSSASNFQSLVTVSQWDAETGRQDWLYRVTACGSRELPSTGESRYQLGIFQSPNGPFIYLGCIAPGSTGQVVRLDQGGDSRPIAETGFPGPLRLTDVLVDPEADRLFLRVANDEGESYWVFDGPSTSYTGVIGTMIGLGPSSSGIDETTGRLYVMAPRTVNGPRTDPGGLFLADGRRSPAPQAIVFPQFSAVGDYRVKVDPAAEGRPTRIFVITRQDFERPRGEQFYRVIRDDIEVSVDPPVADQDRFTTDTEEVPGVTESNFTGTAHAYGLRTVMVGGLEGANGVRSTTTQALSPCLKPDREIVIARVRRAALSNSLASASSIAADAEAVTRTDLQEPGNRCYPRGIAPATQGVDALAQETIGPLIKEADRRGGQQWPFKESECAGDQKIVNTAEMAPGFSATSTCAQSKQDTQASGVGDVFSVPNGPRVGQSYTSVKLARVAERGLVVRGEAWVRGVEVPGAFSIDAATTIAEAFAGGRFGTAGTIFKRSVCGVRIPRAALASLPPDAVKELPQRDGDVFFEGCFDPFTQIGRVGTQTIVNNNITDRPVVFLLNRALGSRGRMRVPDPDYELAKGTPGGYLSSIQKNRGEEIQARAISNDASTEVPAFEIIMFNDDQFAGRGRQLYQFAGVDVSSTYGIFLPRTLDFGADFGSAGAEESLPDLLIDATGGFPALDTPATALLGEQVRPENVVAALVNRVAGGLKFLARTPRQAALASVLWLLLGLPLYLASRRRALMAERAAIVRLQ
jgi:hypothetical protein